jgi:hypothetical protein
MPAPSNTLDSTLNAINSITERYIFPTLEDNINTSNVLLMKIEKQNISGGSDIRVPVRYRRGTQQNYAGSETLNVDYVEKKFSFIFNWKQKNFPITISGLDDIKNNGPQAILDHVKTETQAAEEDAKDSFATGLYSSGSDVLDIDGARVFLSTSNTYGGISQTAQSWARAQVDATTTAFSLSALQTMYEAAKEGNDAVDLICFDEPQFNKYWGLLQPQQRFSDGDTASAGFRNLLFNGATCVEDSYVPTNYVMGFALKHLKLVSSTKRKFPGEFIPFDAPINQDAKVAHIRWAGNLVCGQPRKQFVFTALT